MLTGISLFKRWPMGQDCVHGPSYPLRLSVSSHSSVHACMHSTVTENYSLPVTVMGTRNLAMSKTESREPSALGEGERK